jgi:tol-pal system protein YbgF
MKKYFWVGLLLISSPTFAVFEDEGARKKINEIQDQLNDIQNTVEYSIKEKFIKLENSKNKQSTSKNILDLTNRINALYDELAKLNGEIEVLKYQVKNSEERQKVLYESINDRLLILENYSGKVSDDLGKVSDDSGKVSDDSGKKIQDDQPETKIQDDQSFENQGVSQEAPSDLPPLIDETIEIDAFSEADALLKSTKYKQSFESFDKFISSYPNSEKLVEAKYGLGYSQFALKNYNAAIRTYSKIIESHPNDTKLPEVIYQIANCEIQLTRITRAKKTLRDLIKKYPNVDIIIKAKRKLKALESIKL